MAAGAAASFWANAASGDEDEGGAEAGGGEFLHHAEFISCGFRPAPCADLAMRAPAWPFANELGMNGLFTMSDRRAFDGAADLPLDGLMSHNTFGHLFRVTTFGESHGPAIGCVVDGCPPRIPLEAADIQAELDRRRPGSSRFTTQRREPDEAKNPLRRDGRRRIGGQVTTGAPIALFIENVDQRSKDYGEIKDKYRPGHADYVYDAKYGIRDYRGGGRSSARETAARVAAGAIARKVVAGVRIRGALVQMGKLQDRPRATGTGTRWAGTRSSARTPRPRSDSPTISTKSASPAPRSAR